VRIWSPPLQQHRFSDENDEDLGRERLAARFGVTPATRQTYGDRLAETRDIADVSTLQEGFVLKNPVKCRVSRTLDRLGGLPESSKDEIRAKPGLPERLGGVPPVSETP